MGNIVWIASYPKSGNTWMRVFIEHLLSGNEEIDLNHFVHAGYMASSRRLFDRISGIRASDLTRDEIVALRPDVYRCVSRRSSAPVFIKAHDAYEGGLFPADASLGAIHLVRNPLDVTVSYAYHVSPTPDFDAVIERLCSPRNAITTKSNRLGRQLAVRTGDWSSHVRSWTAEFDFPMITLRYEDLLVDPLASFTRAAQLIDPDADGQRIERAVDRCSFDRLRTFERERGFRERGSKSRAFFRSGRSGTWGEHLSSAQVDRVVSAHRATMRRFGYLDARDTPIDPAGTRAC
jgi:hypothetical protein